MLCVFVFLLSHCLENIFNDDEKEAGVGDVLLQSLVLRFFSLSKRSLFVAEERSVVGKICVKLMLLV